MQWMCAVALMSAMAVQQVPAPWRTYAEQIPIGSTVKVTTTDGERVTAILMVVDDTGIAIKPKTRVPEPARHIRFDRIDEIERQQPQTGSLGHAAATGAIVGGIIIGSFGLLICLSGGCR